MKRRLTNEEFINRAIGIHGNEYDYSKISYVNKHTKIEIICSKHGPFLQRPDHHLYANNKGCGCPICALKKNKRLHTEESFILSATKIHGNKYDYSNVGYLKKKIKVSIKCKKHGIFYQKPIDHLHGQGCPKCSHLISKPEMEFLDYIGVKERNCRLSKWKQKSVDGFDAITNTVYEFLGDYWHGNPEIYNLSDIHPKIKISFGELYDNTLKMLTKVKMLGYNIKYMWETDWKRFKSGIDTKPKIITH